MDAWLPGLHRDGMLVGLNWSGSRATGFEVPPLTFMENLAQMRNSHLHSYWDSSRFSIEERMRDPSREATKVACLSFACPYMNHARAQTSLKASAA